MKRNYNEEIYQYIQQRCQDGIPPTIREICKDLGIKSTSTAHKYVSILVEQGLVEKDSNLTRTLRIPGSDATLIPLVGTITAGEPITAIQNIETYIPFSSSFSRNKEHFALKVRGESMIEAGIFDGDVVIIEKTPVAENGEIVAALIDDEATIKTFYKENGGYRLQPENPTMDPILVDHVEILGKVKASIRYF